MNFVTRVFNPAYGYARASAFLLLGTALTCWPSTAANFAVLVVGIFLVAMGAITLVVSLASKEASGSLMGISGIGTLLFGIVLIVFKSFFLNILIFLLGAVLVVLGLMQIVSLVSEGGRKLSVSHYILSFLVFLCGLLMFFRPKFSSETMFIIFGSALVVYGISELISTYRIMKLRKAFSEEVVPAETVEVQDVDYEEIKEESSEETAE